MRVKVLREQCAGQALCSATAPGVCGSDEEGQVELLISGDVPGELEADARAPFVNLVQVSSLRTRRAFSLRNFGQTSSLKGTCGMSEKIRSRDRPIGK